MLSNGIKQKTSWTRSRVNQSVWAGRLGFNSRQGQWWDFFFLRHCVQTGSAALIQGLKRPEHEADHSPRFWFPAGDGNFSLHHRAQNGSGTPPASYPIRSAALSLGVKRPGREASYSPSSSAEAKDAWRYTSILQYVCMAWCLVQHREKFTFTFTFLFNIFSVLERFCC